LKNLFSKKADFEEVIKDKEALDFHVERFEKGARDPLARACYVYVESRKLK
jgi:hypothetical protein